MHGSAYMYVMVNASTICWITWKLRRSFRKGRMLDKVLKTGTVFGNYFSSESPLKKWPIHFLCCCVGGGRKWESKHLQKPLLFNCLPHHLQVVPLFLNKMCGGQTSPRQYMWVPRAKSPKGRLIEYINTTKWCLVKTQSNAMTQMGLQQRQPRSVREGTRSSPSKPAKLL